MMVEYSYLAHPLSTPLSYDPSFKVDIQLDEPLWKVLLTPSDVAIEIMTLCSQLEPLCQRHYTTKSGKISNSHKIEYQNSFEPKARVVLRKMEEYLHCLPSPQPHLQEYLEGSGLADLFPRVFSYVVNPDLPEFYDQEYPLEVKVTGYDIKGGIFEARNKRKLICNSSFDVISEHFSTFAMINQVVTLSHQLNYDAFNCNNHKYMAHQLALLYQSINQLGGKALTIQKKEIESNFKIFKANLAAKDNESVPKLPDEEKEWINRITKSILDVTASFPKELTKEIETSTMFLQKLN